MVNITRKQADELLDVLAICANTQPEEGRDYRLEKEVAHKYGKGFVFESFVCIARAAQGVENPYDTSEKFWECVEKAIVALMAEGSEIKIE